MKSEIAEAAGMERMTVFHLFAQGGNVLRPGFRWWVSLNIATDGELAKSGEQLAKGSSLYITHKWLEFEAR